MLNKRSADRRSRDAALDYDAVSPNAREEPRTTKTVVRATCFVKEMSALTEKRTKGGSEAVEGEAIVAE